MLVVQFTLTVFVSATLLFLVQPMYARMVQPLLGGSPAVWNTCMVFFQAALLVGYVYAHVTTTWLGVRRQALVHLIVLLFPFLVLPIGLSRITAPPTTNDPVLWLLTVLVISVGLPFFVVSTSAPLMQKWFAHMGHRDSRDPYFLYVASNLGSMLALLGYPTLVEPYLRLSDQSRVWMLGYGVLTLLMGGCALRLFLAPVASGEETFFPAGSANAVELPPPTWKLRGRWVLLSLVPSSLLVGVTTYLTTEIGAVPLLWVMPLAVYLLTFVIVFARRPIPSHELMVRVQPFLVMPMAILTLMDRQIAWGWVQFAPPLLAFLGAAMVCHGELARKRPAPAHLTEFYLWMSLGGVVGGAFNSLLAPVLFTSVVEFPLAVVAACLLRPNRAGEESWTSKQRFRDVALPLMMFVLMAIWFTIQKRMETNAPLVLLGGVFVVGVVAILSYSFQARPVRFGLAMGAILLVPLLGMRGRTTILHAERSFFGIHRVERTEDGRHHQLVHGNTIHGVQALDPAHRREPLVYYHRHSPIGELFASDAAKSWRRIGVVGLGTGTLACYSQPQQEWTYFEIDPAVERLASDPRFFTYLRDSAAPVRIVLGDARLTVAEARECEFDLLVLDAFSSDAIPAHLLTREAIQLYLHKLADRGTMAFHITNRHLELSPVLARLSVDAGLTAYVGTYVPTEDDKDLFPAGSKWVVMSRDGDSLAMLADDSLWTRLDPDPAIPVWTDDFSNLFQVLKWFH
ncbi:MAG: fused MFS/spermidine synthase [Planctomycetales bacterium]|nr:fused MFS/spermidine synthase [Planctomycetales bacterium]